MQVPIGDKAPEVVNAIIEISKGSHNKYEFDEKLGVFMLDRVLYSPVHYPLDYGYVPETRAEDGDHVDVLVIGNDPLIIGCVAKVRPIGMMKMLDKGEQDDKVLAVQKDNPRFDRIKDIGDVDQHLLKEVSHFFQVYKELEGKKVEIQGWEGAEAAKAKIVAGQEAYAQEHK